MHTAKGPQKDRRNQRWHPIIANWVRGGQISPRYGDNIQAVAGMVGPRNQELILHGSMLKPHTIGVHASDILAGNKRVGELIRTVQNAKTGTVPRGEVGYVLNVNKGSFLGALTKLKEKYSDMPDTLWFGLIASRIRKETPEKRKQAKKLIDQRHDLVHELHKGPLGSMTTRPPEVIKRELGEVEAKMKKLAVDL